MVDLISENATLVRKMMTGAFGGTLFSEEPVFGTNGWYDKTALLFCLFVHTLTGTYLFIISYYRSNPKYVLAQKNARFIWGLVHPKQLTRAQIRKV